MALSHILAAITAEADTQISDLANQHGATIATLASGHERSLAHVRETIQRQKQDRLSQLRKRTHDHMDMMKRHAVLDRKQGILDEFYSSLVTSLATLPLHETEALLTRWVKTLPAGGTIFPSKAHESLLKKIAGGHAIGAAIASKGGFRFESDREDRDYTYEFLVEEIVRPDTEIDVASQLFPRA